MHWEAGAKCLERQPQGDREGGIYGLYVKQLCIEWGVHGYKSSADMPFAFLIILTDLKFLFFLFVLDRQYFI